MIRPIRVVVFFAGAGLASACWYVAGNAAPGGAPSVPAALTPWTPVLLLVAGSVLWFLDKVFGPVIEGHSRRLLLGETDEATVVRIFAKMDQAEQELESIRQIANDVIAERDQYLLELLALKRSLNKAPRPADESEQDEAGEDK